MENNCHNYNILKRLSDQAIKQPEKLALIQPGKIDQLMTYSELHQLSLRYAYYFRKKGLGEKDQALLLIQLGPLFYAIFLGLVGAGITVVLIDPGVGVDHMRACLKKIKPTVFIGSAKAHLLRFYSEFRALRAFSTVPLPFSTQMVFDSISDYDLDGFPCVDKNHPALITFTSGSTGRPKGLLRTHGFLLNQGDTLANLMEAKPDTVEFCSFPVFVLSNLGQGVSTILPPQKTAKLNEVNFDYVLKSMEKYHATQLLAAPDFCRGLLSQTNAKTVLARLEKIHTGGGPVFINLLKQLKRIAPKAEITTLYGSTEAEPIALQPMGDFIEEDYEKIASGAGLLAGYPVDNIKLKIVRDRAGQVIEPMDGPAFQQIVLETGNVGEIVVTGELVQKSYIAKEDNNETKFSVEGEVWHRTGDAGYLDEKGRLWLLGRCGAKIELKDGEYIYPFSIEAATTVYTDYNRVAFVQVDNRNILVLEGSPLSENEKQIILKRFSYLNDIIHLAYIPMDKRHHSKVLYTQLKNMISQE